MSMQIRHPQTYRGPLYKFLRREHADRMLRFGEIRIGTLLDFRGLENDLARGDKEEGHRSQVLLVEEATTCHPELAQLVRSTGDYSVKNSVFATHQNLDDYFIYCTSRVFNRSLFREFNAGVCVVIQDRDLFFDAVTRGLGSYVTGERSVLRVAYTNRNTSRLLNQSRDTKDGKTIPDEYWLQVDAGAGFFTVQPVDYSALLSGMWIKHPRFMIQAEVRAIWTASTHPIKPVVIRDSDIAKSCRLYEEA